MDVLIALGEKRAMLRVRTEEPVVVLPVVLVDECVVSSSSKVSLVNWLFKAWSEASILGARKLGPRRSKGGFDGWYPAATSGMKSGKRAAQDTNRVLHGIMKESVEATRSGFGAEKCVDLG